MVAEGDSLPSVKVFSGVFPDPEAVDVADYCKDKSVIIVGLPGDLKAAGVDKVIVYCVNDPAVMQAWGTDQKIEGSYITFMADPAGALTDALDVRMVHPGPPSVGIIGRCKRHAIYAVNGVVKFVAISEAPGDPAGDDDPSASLAPALLTAIKG